MSDGASNVAASDRVLGRDRGSFVLVMAVAVVVAALVAMAVAEVGTTIIHRQRAQTAADAAALAGVDGGRRAAAARATANGAALVEFERTGDDDGWTVTVEVIHGEVSARARASSRP